MTEVGILATLTQMTTDSALPEKGCLLELLCDIYPCRLHVFGCPTHLMGFFQDVKLSDSAASMVVGVIIDSKPRA